MASLFGIVKKIFGGGSKPADGEAAVQSVKDTAASSVETVTDVTEKVSTATSDYLSDVTEKSTESAQLVVSPVDSAASSVGETISDSVSHVAEAAAARVADVANSEIVHEAESVAIAAAGALGGASGAMTDAMTDIVTGTVVGTDEEEVPHLPALELKGPVEYLDRDHFNLPRSELVVKAIALVTEAAGNDAEAKGIRIFEYGVAAAHSYDLRVDRELLLLGALLGELGDGASAKAEAFCLENGMWDALAKKIAFAIEKKGNGLEMDDIETRALTLGVNAEAANGEVDFVHAATAAETRNRNVS